MPSPTLPTFLFAFKFQNMADSEAVPYKIRRRKNMRKQDVGSQFPLTVDNGCQTLQRDSALPAESKQFPGPSSSTNSGQKHIEHNADNDSFYDRIIDDDISALYPSKCVKSGKNAPKQNQAAYLLVKRSCGSHFKVPWTQGEVDVLKAGVEMFGPGKWVQILEYGKNKFHSVRTPVHLKDKYRNLLKRGEIGLQLDASLSDDSAE